MHINNKILFNFIAIFVHIYVFFIKLRSIQSFQIIGFLKLNEQYIFLKKLTTLLTFFIHTSVPQSLSQLSPHVVRSVLLPFSVHTLISAYFLHSI